MTYRRALLVPDPKVFANPDSLRINTVGIRGIEKSSQGLKRKGDRIVVTDERTYNSFIRAGWEPTELPPEPVGN